MPPLLSDAAPPRRAAVVNEAIRALVAGAQGRSWTWAEGALYGLLRDEWVAAMAAEREQLVTAA